MNDTVLRIAFPGVLFVFAVTIVVQAVQMTGPLVESNAHLYPLVVAALLAVGALGSMIGAMRGDTGPGDTAAAEASAGLHRHAAPSAALGSASALDSTVPAAEATGAEADQGGRRRVLLVLAGSVAYPLIMPVAGFHVATVLYAFGLSFLLQDRSRRGAVWAAAVAVGVTVFCHLAFVVVLGARLPSGSVL